MIWWVIYDITLSKRLKKIAKECKKAGLCQV